MKLNQRWKNLDWVYRHCISYSVVALMAAIILQSCASLGVPTPQSFNEKEAAAISSVTAARTTALSLLTSGKITAPDAANIQKQCDNAREAITLADTIHATDPAAGTTRLDVAVAGLTALQAYLATRSH